MRSLVFIASFVIVATLTSSVQAQRPYRSKVRTASFNSYQEKAKGFSLSDRLIYERALFRAHNRAARIQARKWAGISLARPSIILSPYRRIRTQAIYPQWAGQRAATWSNNSIR